MDRARGGSPALWLRQDGRPGTLPLAITVHPRVLFHHTSLRAHVERRSLLIEQVTECTVHFGILDHLDAEFRRAAGRWEVEGSEVRSWTELGSTPQGDRLVRLEFSKEVSDTLRLRFRIREPVSSRPEPDRPIDLEVPWVKLVEGKTLPMQVRVASEAGIDLEPRGAGWIRVVDEEASGGGRARPSSPVDAC